MPAYLSFDSDKLAEVCRRYHIRRLSLFGSVLKGSQRAESDVDLLVEFEPGRRLACFAWRRSNLSCRRSWADGALTCAPLAI